MLRDHREVDFVMYGERGLVAIERDRATPRDHPLLLGEEMVAEIGARHPTAM